MAEVAFPIVICLAGEPQGKGRPRSRIVRKPGAASFVQTYTPGQTRKYEDQLRLAAQAVMGEAAPVEGPVFLTLTATMPIPASMSKKDRAKAISGELWPTKKPDFDNLVKVTDALNKVVYSDDKQVVVGTVVKIYGEKPSMRIVIRRPDRVAA